MTEAKAQIRCVGAILLVLLVCLGVIALPIVVSNVSAQWQQNQQLAALDQQFSVSRTPIPVASDQTFLPEQIGNFQREELMPANDSSCENHSKAPLQCFAAIYQTSVDSDRSWVWVSIWRKSEAEPQSLNDMLLGVYCGGELGGEHVLRTTTTMPYIYRLCYPFLIGSPFLSGVIWENGNWFIRVDGRFEDFTQFIAAYPY